MSSTEPSSRDADRALVEAVLARQPGAFERLVAVHQALCWHIINRMVRHPDDTSELSQEVFLRVYQRLHQFRFESALRTWIGQVAYSISLRHLERKRIATVSAIDDAAEQLEQVSDDFDLETANADAELLAALHAEIEALPPVPRAILTLYHLDEVPIAEIAVVTGIAEGTIKSHLFRARAALRRRLAALLGVAV